MSFRCSQYFLVQSSFRYILLYSADFVSEGECYFILLLIPFPFSLVYVKYLRLFKKFILIDSVTVWKEQMWCTFTRNIEDSASWHDEETLRTRWWGAVRFATPLDFGFFISGLTLFHTFDVFLWATKGSLSKLLLH